MPSYGYTPAPAAHPKQVLPGAPLPSKSHPVPGLQEGGMSFTLFQPVQPGQPLPQLTPDQVQQLLLQHQQLLQLHFSQQPSSLHIQPPFPNSATPQQLPLPWERQHQH